MLGLPEKTELKRIIPKEQFLPFFTKYGEKTWIDGEISQVTFVNELSSATIPNLDGENIKSIFVMKVALKKRDFDRKIIALLPHYIKANIVYALSYGNQLCLMIQYRDNLYFSEWQTEQNTKLDSIGMNLDAVWENFVAQIAQVKFNPGQDLGKTLEVKREIVKLEAEIESFDKKEKKAVQMREKEKWHDKKLACMRRLEMLKGGLKNG